MAIAKKIDLATLKVANTSNVKEMKNGRPVSIRFDATEAKELPNCTIIKLNGTLQAEAPELDHVYQAVVLEASAVAAAVEAGEAFLVVAPEIMVEEARRTDGHIGKFRFEKGEVYTAYQLHVGDRIEVSANHDFKAAGKEISVRDMAMPVIMAPTANEMYDEALIKMHKIEF